MVFVVAASSDEVDVRSLPRLATAWLDAVAVVGPESIAVAAVGALPVCPWRGRGSVSQFCVCSGNMRGCICEADRS